MSKKNQGRIRPAAATGRTADAIRAGWPLAKGPAPIQGDPDWDPAAEEAPEALPDVMVLTYGRGSDARQMLEIPAGHFLQGFEITLANGYQFLIKPLAGVLSVSVMTPDGLAVIPFNGRSVHVAGVDRDGV